MDRVLIWSLVLWLFGWLLLPLSRRLFTALPDGGLAPGRVVGLVSFSLIAFWLASLQLVSLQMAPLYVIGGPALCAVLSLRTKSQRDEFKLWLHDNKSALVWSDVVFFVIWFFFLWIRARNPAIGDLEKPMDAALLGALSRTHYLPFDNPWFSGIPFTNYYYFGPFMGSLLARTLVTPNSIAYNMVQPLFCALFVSSLWSVCSALTDSLKLGTGATIIVALLGNFEPLRQIGQALLYHRHPNDALAQGHLFWPYDWWTTSRIILGTINEYPAFTLAIGDAHAHFYAFSVAAALFGLCYSLFHDRDVDDQKSGRPRSHKLVSLGVLLAGSWLTSTWDVPLYALLVFVCALMSMPRRSAQSLAFCFVPLVLAKILAWPYSRLSHPNIGGDGHGVIAFDFWLPAPQSFAFAWGGVLIMLVCAHFFTQQPRWKRHFSTVMVGVGFLALVVPFCFYIRGVFGDGPQRHQDTIFKFGLQAWLLLGTAGACGVLTAWPKWKIPQRLGALAFLVVPLLCSTSVVWARTVQFAARDANGNVNLSLDGASIYTPAEQDAFNWLADNAKPGETVLEAAGDNDYTGLSRVSAITGVSTPLGWPQHVESWGAPYAQVLTRHADIDRVYAWRTTDDALATLHRLNVRYVFVGDFERKTYDAAALARMRAALDVGYENGDTFIAIVPPSTALPQHQ